MALWGEGDPRWIVEERPDATNVNNWHWSEKNASAWSREKFKSLFDCVNLKVPDVGVMSLKYVSSDGDAVVNNRKGKLIFFYEWTMKIEWTATADEKPDLLCKGDIEILNLSEENEPHEIDISATVTSGGETGDKFKSYLYKKGKEEVQQILGEYIKSLKKEYASGILLPTKEQNSVKQSKTVINKNETKLNNVINQAKSKDSKIEGIKLETESLKLICRFKCTAEELYRALTNREMVAAFSQAEVKLEPKVGGKFELFGGNISGEFTLLQPNEKINQKWRFKQWPDGHVSDVKMTIVQEEEETGLELEQRGIPKSDFERTRIGWNSYYFEAIKRTFGFGALLF